MDRPSDHQNKRADAEGIAQEVEGARVAVPDGDHELAVEHPGHAGAVLLVEVQQDLDLGVGAKDVALGGKGCAQLEVVVDLAVEDDGDGLVLVEDRLLAGGDVDDGEPPRPEGNARPFPEAGRIRARDAAGSASSVRGPLGRWAR